MALVDLQFRLHVGVAWFGRCGIQQGPEEFHGYGLIKKTEDRSKKKEERICNGGYSNGGYKNNRTK